MKEMKDFYFSRKQLNQQYDYILRFPINTVCINGEWKIYTECCNVGQKINNTWDDNIYLGQADLWKDTKTLNETKENYD